MKGRCASNTRYIASLAILILGCDRTPEPDDSAIVIRSPNAAFVRSAGAISDEGVRQIREESCVSEPSRPFLAPPLLSLVVDVSGSMSLAPQSGGESKWEITRAALSSAITQLPEGVTLGAVFFPNQATPRNCVDPEGPCLVGEELDPSSCINLDTVVSLAPLGPSNSAQRQSLEFALDQVNPAGGTPTHDAIELATSILEEAEGEGERFLLLITDGQPTFLSGCRGSGSAEEPVDEVPVVAAVAAGFDRGIRSFVVGSPGSEQNVSTGEDVRGWLSEAAIAGGSASPHCSTEEGDYCHYDLSDPRHYAQDLLGALEDILGQVRSCSFPLPEPPPEMKLDLEAVNVVLLGNDSAEVLVRSEDPRCSEGWYLDSERVELCSGTCGRRQTSLHTEVETFFSCNSVAPVVTK